ncbi:P22 phage major capsid protein family protein [Tundrisphaera sp. TA3]|uniref:P22 phage major capsid protein family protein n=1 Tax=Tundrisphaera sp. TA3 TaxID=3435775 RepID=UPI003EC10798
MANSYPSEFFSYLPVAVEDAAKNKASQHFMLDAISRNFSGAIGDDNDAIAFYKATSGYTVTNVGAGELTVSDVAATKVNIAMDQHPAIWFKIPDFDRVRTAVDLRGLFLDEAIYKVAKFGADRLSTYVTGTNFNVNTAIPAEGSVVNTITDNQMGLAWQKLADTGLDMRDGNLFLATPTAVYANLVNTPSWNQVVSQGNPAPYIRSSAILGRQWNAYADYQTGLPLSAGGNMQSILFHKDAFGFAARALPTPQAGGVKSRTVYYNGLPIRFAIDWNQQKLAEMISVDALFGVGVVDPAKAVLIISAKA